MIQLLDCRVLLVCLMFFTSTIEAAEYELLLGTGKVCQEFQQTLNRLPASTYGGVQLNALAETLGKSETATMKLGSNAFSHGKNDLYVQLKLYDVDNNGEDEVVARTDLPAGKKRFRTNIFIFKREQDDISAEKKRLRKYFESIGWSRQKGLHAQSLFQRPLTVKGADIKNKQSLELTFSKFDVVPVRFNNQTLFVLWSWGAPKSLAGYYLLYEVKKVQSGYTPILQCLFRPQP